MRQLTKDQDDMINVIQSYRSTLKIKAMINECLDQPLTEISDIINLNNLYSLFFASMKDN